MTGEERRATLAALDAALDALDTLNDRVTLLVTQLPTDTMPGFTFRRIQLAGDNIERAVRAARQVLSAVQQPVTTTTGAQHSVASS